MKRVPAPSGLPSIRPLIPEGGPRLFAFLLGLLLIGMSGGPDAAHAQVGVDSLRLQPLSPTAQARGGVQLMRKGRPADARPYLKRAFAADSTLFLPTHGAVAYWLGKAYAQLGDSARAHAAWHRGYKQLRAADRFDVRLADAYIRSLDRSQLRQNRLQAANAYFELMGRATSDTSEAVRDLFRRRVAQIVPLMSDPVFAQVVKGKRADKPKAWTLRPTAGDSLQAWWRGLDPFPDTPENERLEEHLTRLVHARRSFSCPGRTSALDRRGTVYLRFGAPYKRRELRYKDTDFFQEVFRFGVHLSPDAFPESEIWLYPQIDQSGFYLFAEKGTSGCFQLARANDLFPNALKQQKGKTKRGLNYAYSALMAMQAVYRELALYHINFGNRYSKIANYASYQKMQATKAEAERRLGTDFGGAEQQTTVGSGATARTVTENPAAGIQSPNFFVSRIVRQARREDAAAAERRKENMPRQYSALRGDTPKMPVAVRTARFLTEEGSTRTEIYWGVPAAAARLEPDEEGESPPPSMIRFSVTQHNDDRTRVRRKQSRHRLPARPAGSQQMFVPPSVTLKGTSSQQHLSMQWTQYRLWQNEDGSIAGMGPKRRYAAGRIDSLGPLRPSGPAPEMSDLKVLTLPDTSAATLTNLADKAVPYPFRRIGPKTPVLLSFEIYHLSYGADDRTRYALSYTVEGETKRGWTRLFRGQDTQRTTTEMTRRGTRRRTKEQIIIDLSRIEREEAQDVRVVVRVTDKVTGASVTRAVDFILQPSDGS
ncbi:MAG: tetratricopeptide repeat protein [Salinibacter sp.]